MASPNEPHRSLNPREQQQVWDLYNCRACARVDTGETVQCDSCDGWYHYECAGQGITHDIADVPWCCSDCVEQQFIGTLTPHNQSSIYSTPMTTATKVEPGMTRGYGFDSSQSIASTSTRQSRTSVRNYLEQQRRLELEQMERSFEMQRQNLQEKFRIMTLEFESNRSSMNVNEGSVQSVDQWVIEQSNYADSFTPVKHFGRNASTPVVIPTQAYTKIDVHYPQRKTGHQIVSSILTLPSHPRKVQADIPVIHQTPGPSLLLRQNPPAIYDHAAHSGLSQVGLAGLIQDPISHQANADATKNATGKWPFIPRDSFYFRSSDQKDEPEPNGKEKHVPSRLGETSDQVTMNPQLNVNQLVQSQVVEKIPNPPKEVQPISSVAVLNTRGTLSAEQIAARHVLPRELPKFYGSPAEWPIFIRYDSSTSMGGYSNAENLIRLQRCLQGKARLFEAFYCHRKMYPVSLTL